MRTALILGGALALSASGAAAASAFAASGTSLPIPTVPTVSTPSLPAPPSLPLPVKPPAPTPPAPKPPAPSPPISVSSPVPAPSAPASLPSTSSNQTTVRSATVVHSIASAGTSQSQPAGTAQGGSGGTGSPSGGSGSATSGSTAGTQQSSSRGFTRLRTSRAWISLTGKRSARTIVLTFQLARKGRVVFTLFEVSPVCRTAARFGILGHAGVNRVRFNGRVHGRTLPPGTYQLRAHKRGSGTVLHVTLVIAATPLPVSSLTQARAANVCSATASLPAPFAGSELAAATIAGGAGAPASEIVRNQNPSQTADSSQAGTPSAAGPFSPARLSKNAANPLVIVTLALAMLLLGLAALPQAAVPDARLSYLLARHRIEVALAGAAALAAALVVLALA